MRVSLFGLSPRGINLMNLSIELVQLVLSHQFIPSFDALFLFMCACAHDKVFNACYFIRIYQYMCDYPCKSLGICNTTRWGVTTPLDPYVQVSEPGSGGFSLSLIRVAQRKRESSTNRLKPHPSGPLLGFRVFLLRLWAFFCTIHYCISLCILAFVLSGDVIFL